MSVMSHLLFLPPLSIFISFFFKNSTPFADKIRKEQFLLPLIKIVKFITVEKI